MRPLRPAPSFRSTGVGRSFDGGAGYVLTEKKIAVVTGGSTGIGPATAKRFVEEGAYVFIAGRRKAELDKAVEEIGSNVTGVKSDISKLNDLDRLYELVAKRDKIDVMFACAAFVEKTMTATVTPEHFDKTFNTNARGTYFTVQTALPQLNDGASIILVASAGKNKGLPRPQHLQRHQGMPMQMHQRDNGAQPRLLGKR